MSQTIINGDSAEVLKQFKDNTIDAVITDPPYGIEFLGKEWDRNTGAIEIWRECLRVLKPGGYLLAFSAARTYHHLATNIESVGFDIRDQIMWIYASGFPKAQDMGKAIQKRLGVKETTQHKNNAPRIGGVAQGEEIKQQEQVLVTDPEALKWAGWKTALKPGHEPIVMARKPMKGSTIDNVLQHGVGALNIDATRIPFAGKDTRSGGADGWSRTEYGEREPAKYKDQRPRGRALDKVVIGGGSHTPNQLDQPEYTPNEQGRYPSNVLGDIADYQKYFYSPKVNRGERHRGFEQEHIPDPLANYAQGDVKNHPLWDPSIGTNLQRLKHKILEHNSDLGKKTDPLAHIPSNPEGMLDKNGGTRYIDGGNKQHNVGNNHPTVKPVALMKYLVRLVTPQGSHVIDPFAGSGSTSMACRELARQFTGIDLDPRYCEIARKRIAATQEDLTETLFE
jgi:DNA modification methylase